MKVKPEEFIVRVLEIALYSSVCLELGFITGALCGGSWDFSWYGLEAICYIFLVWAGFKIWTEILEELRGINKKLEGDEKTE